MVYLDIYPDKLLNEITLQDILQDKMSRKKKML